MDTAVNADAEKTSQKSMEGAMEAAPAHECTHDYKGINEDIHHADGEEHTENLSEELIKVKADEDRHITGKRMLFYFVNFCFLFAA